ncbi:alpha/beta fold hydrolase [Actinocrinis puniceicyclus]|uniref:Alpha/beta fold hydrolase n=1 Tax=Actinocrinis puniceicyclus TaxID=977794 RepID=A0A8J8BBE3_9ACTN|nr:alpha/beta hydrolase [Actinocrinis puniceicyclus]MBS2961986.1 alpha/beta fold hydrolase [Actinocrinis puniceicyclus]
MTDADSTTQPSRFDVDGVSIAYEEAGAGERTPLVFIHGWTANRHRWDHQFEHFARTRRVLRLDLRGHGESDKPAGQYSIDGLADDVRRLLDARGVGRFIPVGHSMGGMIAQKLALAEPDRVERMVLVGTVSRMVYSRSRGAVIAASKLVPYNSFVAINIQRAFKPGYPKELIRQYVAASQATPRHVVMSCYDAMRDFDVLDQVGDIRAPVLIVHGRHDIQFPPAQVQRIAANCPNATVKLLDTGHECPVEDPQAVTDAIEAFLGEE